MNLEQKLSLYKLKLTDYSIVPSIAITAIEEGYNSESLLICAGMTEGDNSFELELYFKKALKELNIELPEDKDAFYIVALYYLEGILSGEISFLDGMYFIDEKLLDNGFRIFGEDKKYAYDSTGLHSIWGGYVAYRDMNYYINMNELIGGRDPNEVQEEYKKQVLEDIEKYVNEFNNLSS